MRGMKEKEMDLIADWVDQVVRYIGPRQMPEKQEATSPERSRRRSEMREEFKKEIENDKFLKKINLQVKNLCQKFPIP